MEPMDSELRNELLIIKAGLATHQLSKETAEEMEAEARAKFVARQRRYVIRSNDGRYYSKNGCAQLWTNDEAQARRYSKMEAEAWCQTLSKTDAQMQPRAQLLSDEKVAA